MIRYPKIPETTAIALGDMPDVTKPVRQRKIACARGEFPVRRLTLQTGGCQWRGPRPRPKTPKAIADLVRNHFNALAQESFIVLAMSSSNEIIGAAEIALGSISAAPVDPRLVFGFVVSAAASAMVVIHNHPSGSLDPSHEDVEFTRRLYDIAKLLTIAMLDSLIVTRDGYASFLELGMMPTGR